MPALILTVLYATSPSTSLIYELARYGLAGVFSYGLGIGLTVFLREILRLPESMAVGISLVVMMTANFLIGRYFVFRSGGNTSPQALRFTVTSACMRATEFGLFSLFNVWLHYVTAMTVALIISNLFKYFAYRNFVFHVPQSPKRPLMKTPLVPMPKRCRYHCRACSLCSEVKDF